MVQVSGGQLITSTGQPIMVQAVPGGQGQTIMQVPVSGTQGLQQVSGMKKCLDSIRIKIFKEQFIMNFDTWHLHLISSYSLFAFSCYPTFVLLCNKVELCRNCASLLRTKD